MADLVIGVVVAVGFFLLLNYARRKDLKPSWWGWMATVLGFLDGIFVLELIVSFLAEGSARAAVVMGSILGFVAVIWGVLLGRFVFARPRKEDL